MDVDGKAPWSETKITFAKYTIVNCMVMIAKLSLFLSFCCSSYYIYCTSIEIQPTFYHLTNSSIVTASHRRFAGTMQYQPYSKQTSFTSKDNFDHSFEEISKKDILHFQGETLIYWRDFSSFLTFYPLAVHC